MVLNLLHKQTTDYTLVLSLLYFISPFEEEVLEGKVILLPVSEPLFFAHLIQLRLELIEHTPLFILLLKFILHLVVEGEFRLILLEMLTISVSPHDFLLEFVPLLT